MTSSADIGGALTFSDYVADTLRSDIVNGAFAPQAKLAMKDLCARYRVGLSPLREALHRLVGEGFVHSVGQRGFTVPPLSMDDLHDLTELRLIVEETALRQAIARGDDAWEAGVVAAFHRLERQAGRINATSEASIARYDAVHRDFHVALFAGVTSARLCQLQMNLFDQAFRYRKCLHSRALDAQEVLDEHRQLMASVLSRDTARAVAAVRGHLSLTRNHLDARASAGHHATPATASGSPA